VIRSLLTSLVLSAGSMAASPLLLDDVLRSAESAYPLLLAAIEERRMAQGKALSAEGAFDTKLSLSSEANQFGYYKNRANEAKVEQPLADWGGEIFGGYKRGRGEFGPWEQDLLTLSRGEWSGGVRLPLLRDRETDERRTELLLARLSVELADASIEKQRLKLLETAAKSYWDWVSSGQKLAIAEALLQLAEARIEQVREAAGAGEIAEIEIVDNQRAVLERRSAVISAERELQNAVFELSLFYRNANGEPQIVSRDRLPDFPEPAIISVEHMQEGLQQALARRPEIAGMLVEARQRTAELELARNQLLPQIDFSAKYGRDSGAGPLTKRGGEFVAGVTLESPFQRRKAKGAAAVQEAKLEQLDQRLRFARNQIEVQVRDAVSALNAALQRLELARAEQDAAQQLAEAEQERFELGDSTLFVVNLRELAAASARLKVADTLADWHKAAATYRAATAAF
jgi:outer membrane protein TolC